MSDDFHLLDKSIPYLQESLIDNPVTTHHPVRSSVRVFGKNPLVNNVRLALWEGPTADYVPPAAATQLALSSTSAEDSAAGSGIQQVHIHYLDDTYTEQVETVTMNGTTAATTTATNILRINSIHAWTVGASSVAVGAISLKKSCGNNHI